MAFEVYESKIVRNPVPKFDLPVMYDKLSFVNRRIVREMYIKQQGGCCMHCGISLSELPCDSVATKRINWKLFPENFLKHPIHLQHCHKTGLTEGAVHAYCNAVLWQYYGR